MNKLQKCMIIYLIIDNCGCAFDSDNCLTYSMGCGNHADRICCFLRWKSSCYCKVINGGTFNNLNHSFVSFNSSDVISSTENVVFAEQADLFSIAMNESAKIGGYIPSVPGIGVGSLIIANISSFLIVIVLVLGICIYLCNSRIVFDRGISCLWRLWQSRRLIVRDIELV